MAYDSKPGWSGVFVAPTSSRETRAAGISVDDTTDEFLEAVDEGFARDRHGRPYTPEAARELHTNLGGYLSAQLGVMGLGDVRRQDVEDVIFALGASGLPHDRLLSLKRSVRALYDYAAQRDLVRHNPAVRVALPDEDEDDAGPRPERGALDRAITLTLRLATLAFMLAAVVLIAESL